MCERVWTLPVLVSLSAPHPFTEAFRSGLRDLGYIDSWCPRVALDLAACSDIFTCRTFRQGGRPAARFLATLAEHQLPFAIYAASSVTWPKLAATVDLVQGFRAAEELSAGDRVIITVCEEMRRSGEDIRHTHWESLRPS